jgi:uncharacterized membrane protein YgcG
MKTNVWVTAVALAVACLAACPAAALGQTQADDTNGGAAFGILKGAAADAVQAKAIAWLKQATKNDSAKIAQAAALWTRPDYSTLDDLADTFALGSADAAQLLKVVRDPLTPPPTEVPAVLKDTKADPFFRANLGLAVARALSNRRVHEEALQVMMTVAPEQTIDPAAYLFHRAVCEHALLKKNEAGDTIVRLIQDAIDSPERFKTVGALMLLDMETWRKDMGNVARLMNNSERRLDIGRAGPQTQKIQREVIARLDELIKELENQAKGGGGGGGGGGGSGGGGSCPDGGGNGGSGGGARVTSPMRDSQIATNGGSGRVDTARLKQITENWGKMPAAERAKARQEVEDLVNGLSPIHREAFERYFEEINNETVRGTKKQ